MNRRLIALAKGEASSWSASRNNLRPMTVTFHRAFDRTADPMKALEDIIYLGCDRILTSGQQPKAIDGTALLAKLEKKIEELEKSKGKESQGGHPTHRLQLLAGSGVNEENIREIFEATGIHEYHFSARVNVPSRMKHYNHEVYMGAKGVDESNSLVTSVERVRNTIHNLMETKKQG